MSLYPVVMAGGSGTRFWPLSRRSKPKQFLALASRNPLIVDTVRRVRGLAPLSRTFIVCGPHHAKAAEKLVRGIPRANVLVEPVPRNTSAALGLAATHIASRDEDGVLVALPSDHHVADVPAFQRALQVAARAAAKGCIVTVGLRPSRPETGYGYLRVGEALSEDVHRVASFVEKPDRATAEQYLASGHHLWNGGIFVFRADVMLDAIAQHLPHMSLGLAEIGKAIGTKRYTNVLGRVFPRLESISIDFGVAEKADNIAVVPAEFGWSDVGSFASIPEVRPLDERRNVIGGNALAVDCSGSVLLGGKRLLAVVGMSDVVVVDADDAVLVVPKDRAQDVRKIVEKLKGKHSRYQ